MTKSKLLLVEGKDEFNFFGALLRHLRRQDVKVGAYDGKDNLRPFLRGLTQLPDFEAVESIGIVRDADDDANAAFQSVCSSLSNANLPVPEAPLALALGQPQVAVMIMPPGANAGMLEDLCLSAFRDDPATPCVDQYFRCIESRLGSLPRHEAKARVHAFLASRERPDLRLGEAALGGYLPWDSPVFESVKTFINQL
ncbi:MAG: hypothetical protein O7E52_24940 [Candidatus Poribacteria bacterium]|nr:hypothetical protein [Candidatus Poribacteria bacterium]